MSQKSPRDDGEAVSRFEPLMVSDGSALRAPLNDLALELATASARFVGSLPGSIAGALADMIRSMNCYYSNLIEGHHTHPIDIERALNDDYSADPEKRDLQHEAKAHITVQRWIDEGGSSENPVSLQMIREIHRRFYESVPGDLFSGDILFVEMPSTGERIPVVPGEFRRQDVEIGRHRAVSPGSIPRFLDRLHDAHRGAGRLESILAAGCAHHRLLWIHPFLDGNGRVARLMSYAMLRRSLDTKGLWSVARGLARKEAEYKSHLAACDQPRRGDRDGRGALSEAALAEFTAFFLDTCIDQIDFMQGLMKPDRLRDRILIWAEEEMRAGILPTNSDRVLRAVLMQGSVTRAEVTSLLGTTQRTARRATSALLEIGALQSKSMRAPLQIAFPAKLAGRWMPGLFPDK
ncbi:MAG: Fic family protein [Ectothiorhodospiraceae bacterium AqS1]|nr:Fic family protein [Ectothiorhodospiraceae bacterium AqS1]